MFWGAWAACLPAIQRATGASDAQLGLALLCVALAALPAMLVAGRLSDAFGAARLVPISLVFFGLVATLPGLARSVGMLVVFLAFNKIHRGAEDWIERLFFQAWHHREAALRKFVKQAAHVVSPAALLESFRAALDRFCEGARCAIEVAKTLVDLGVDASGLAFPSERPAKWRRKKVF